MKVIITPSMRTPLRAARSRTSASAWPCGTPTRPMPVSTHTWIGTGVPAAAAARSQRVADRRVDHRDDAAPVQLGQFRRRHGPHQQHRFLHAGIAKALGLLALHHREGLDRGRGFEETGHGGHAQSVAVVLDHREDRLALRRARDLAHVVGEVRRVHLDPRVEACRRRSRGRRLSGGCPSWPGRRGRRCGQDLASRGRTLRDYSRTRRPAGSSAAPAYSAAAPDFRA